MHLQTSIYKCCLNIIHKMFNSTNNSWEMVAMSLMNWWLCVRPLAPDHSIPSDVGPGPGMGWGKVSPDRAHTGCLAHEQVGVKRCHYHNRILLSLPAACRPGQAVIFTGWGHEWSGNVSMYMFWTKLIILIASSCAIAGLCQCLGSVSNVR